MSVARTLVSGWMAGAAAALPLAACTGTKPSFDTSECCDDCCTPECSYAGYEWSDLYEYPSSDNSANWIHAADRVVLLNLDAASFAENVVWYTDDTPLTERNVVDAYQVLVDYWNLAGANIELQFDSTAKDCCNSLTDSGCVTCLGDGENDIFYYEGDSLEISEEEAAAFARSYADSDAAEMFCLEEMDLVVFAGYYQTWTGDAASSSDWCEYIWQYNWTDWPIDDDCAGDSIKQKAFKDTVVMELGHVLGLDHQPAYPESAVNNGCSGCSYEEVGDVDRTCLTELYDACG